MFKSAQNKGYTLLEVLIVIVVIGMILVFGVTSYSGFNERQKIKLARQQVLNDLHYARSMATNGRKPEGCSEVLEGYMFAVPSPDSNQYSVYPVCVNEDGTPGPACSSSECGAVTRHVELDLAMQVRIQLGNPHDGILFYTLGRGTNIKHPLNDRIVVLQAPTISEDVEYKIIVNSAGSISPQ